jgi:hypothetical protein
VQDFNSIRAYSRPSLRQKVESSTGAISLSLKPKRLVDELARFAVGAVEQRRVASLADADAGISRRET